MIRPLIPTSLACLFVAVSAAQAQPPQPGLTLEMASSYSADGDVSLDGRTLGELSVTSFELDARWQHPLGPTSTYSVGFSATQFSVDTLTGAPVSDTYQGLALHLGTSWRLTPEWMLTASIQPGLYGDGESLGSDAFNVPGLVLASYRMSETLSFFGGLRVDTWSDLPVLPILGFRWQASPEWTVSFGAPRAEVAYKLSPTTTLFTGAGVQGGSFHTDDASVVAPAGYPSLRDTEVDYREIRVGLGARWALDGGTRIELEGGWTVDRRFDYDDRNVTVKVDNAPYVRLSLNTRF